MATVIGPGGVPPKQAQLAYLRRQQYPRRNEGVVGGNHLRGARERVSVRASECERVLARKRACRSWLVLQTSEVSGLFQPNLDEFPPRVHMVQDAPLHHPQCSSVAVRHLGARGISCTELHRAPRCRRTSLHFPASAPSVREACTEFWHRWCREQGCTCEVHVVPLLVFSKSIKG